MQKRHWFDAFRDDRELSRRLYGEPVPEVLPDTWRRLTLAASPNCHPDPGFDERSRVGRPIEYQFSECVVWVHDLVRWMQGTAERTDWETIAYVLACFGGWDLYAWRCHHGTLNPRGRGHWEWDTLYSRGPREPNLARVGDAVPLPDVWPRDFDKHKAMDLLREKAEEAYRRYRPEVEGPICRPPSDWTTV